MIPTRFQRRVLLPGTAAALLVLSLGLAYQRQQKLGGPPAMVADIIRADCTVEPTDPPTLTVTVCAVDPTGLYREPRLLRAAYDTPPRDGTQDYFLLAIPPGELSQRAEKEFTVKHLWVGFREAAPWLKAIRVHGSQGAVGTLVPNAR